MDFLILIFYKLYIHMYVYVHIFNIKFSQIHYLCIIKIITLTEMRNSETINSMLISKTEMYTNYKAMSAK